MATRFTGFQPRFPLFEVTFAVFGTGSVDSETGSPFRGGSS
jgi:hypothetical protein